MNDTELRREVEIEFGAIRRTLDEIAALCRDVAGRTPTTREVAAAGLFLANFYNGVENVLKRLWLFHGQPLPTGENWHVELLRGFCEPARPGLPQLLDAPLAEALSPYRRFRHVVHHGYGFQLRWEQMRSGMEEATGVFQRFQARVEEALPQS